MSLASENDEGNQFFLKWLVRIFSSFYKIYSEKDFFFLTKKKKQNNKTKNSESKCDGRTESYAL